MVSEAAQLYQFITNEAAHDSCSFAEAVLNDESLNPIIQADIHEEMHDFIFTNDRGVIEFPREHGKTTQMIALIAFLIGLNPNERHKIISSSDTEAVKRGKAIRELLESPDYQAVFPHIQRGREWKDGRFSVKREVITPESTVECYGLHSKALGGRADWEWFDDPDDEEVVTSETVRTKNVNRVNNVHLNLLAPNARAYILCTPWHELDIAHDRKKSGWPVLRFPIEEMKPVWPGRWTRKLLKKKKQEIGSLAFARGYELVPISTENAPIKGTYFRYWEDPPKLNVLCIACDPAASLEEGKSYTAIGVLGGEKVPVRGEYQYKVHLLQVLRGRWEFPELMNEILDLAERVDEDYRLTPTIGIEQVAFQKAVPQALRRKSRFPIVGVKPTDNKRAGVWKGGSKFVRASRLAVHIENGRVYLKGRKGQVHPEQKVVYDECTMYPASAHKDCLDMLGYGVEMVLKQLGRPVPVASGGRR